MELHLHACSFAADLFIEVAEAVNGGTTPSAVTVGGLVIYTDPPTEALRRHEAVHVKQQAAFCPRWLRWLPLSAQAWIGMPKFLAAYYAEHRRVGYAINRFEVEARAAEAGP